MLFLCKADLKREDLLRLEKKLAPVPGRVRWGRRGDRLVLLLENARMEKEALAELAGDPAVDYLLQDPSPGEISRIFTRRDLLDLALVTTGALAAAAVLGPVGVFLNAEVEDRTPRGEVRVGSLDALPVNSAVSRVIDGEEFLVIRREENQLHAVSATCTHSDVCLVKWDPARAQLVCPCHRGAFDVYGNVVAGPPPRPLASREVVVREGTIYLRRGSS